MRRTLEHMCSTPLLGRIALFIVYASDDVGRGYCKRPFIGYCNDENLHFAYASSTGKIPGLATLRQEGAFYSTLLRLANSYGVKREDGIFIDIALTNQELAEFAATSREV